MVMSEKIKPGDPPETAAANPRSEPVPDWLQSRLRRMFSDVMDEPVPDEFKALLQATGRQGARLLMGRVPVFCHLSRAGS